jgi:tetratricopeptide (TPR) repeat protein
MTDDKNKKTPAAAPGKSGAAIPSAPDIARAVIAGRISFKELTGIPDEQMLTVANHAYFLYAQGRYDEAEPLFKALEACDRKNAYYPAGLGAIYLGENRLDDALTALNRALGVDAKDLSALINRGEVYRRQSRLKEAQADFEAVLDLDPDAETDYGKRARAMLSGAVAALGGIPAASSPGGETGNRPAAPAAPKNPKSDLPK